MTRYLAEVHVVVEVPLYADDPSGAAARAEIYAENALRKAGLEVQIIRTDAVEDSVPHPELFEVPC